MESKNLVDALLTLIRVFQSYGITFSNSSNTTDSSDNAFKKMFEWANHLINIILHDWFHIRKIENVEMIIMLSCAFPFFVSTLFLGFTHGFLFVLICFCTSFSTILYVWVLNQIIIHSLGGLAVIIAIQSICFIGLAYMVIIYRSSGWNWRSFPKCQSKTENTVFWVIAILGMPGSVFILFFLYHIGNDNKMWVLQHDPQPINRLVGSITSFGVVSLMSFFLVHFTAGYGNQPLYFIMIILGIVLVAHFVYELTYGFHAIKREVLVTYICKGYVIASGLLIIPSVDFFFNCHSSSVDGNQNIAYGGLYFYLWTISVAFPLFYTAIFSYIGYKIRKETIPLVFRLFLTNIFSVSSFLCHDYKARFVLWPVVNMTVGLLYAIFAGSNIPIANIVLCIIMGILTGVFRPHLNLSKTIISIGEYSILLMANCIAVHQQRTDSDTPQWVAIFLIVLSFIPMILSIIYFIWKEFNHQQDIIEKDILWELRAKKITGVDNSNEKKSENTKKKDKKKSKNKNKNNKNMKKKSQTKNEKKKSNKSPKVSPIPTIVMGGGGYYHEDISENSDEYDEEVPHGPFPRPPDPPTIEVHEATSKKAQIERLFFLLRELNTEFQAPEEEFRFDEKLSEKFEGKAQEMKNQNDKVVIFLSYFCLSIFFFVGIFTFYQSASINW